MDVSAPARVTAQDSASAAAVRLARALFPFTSRATNRISRYRFDRLDGAM